MRATPGSLPQKVVDRMKPEDREALGLQSTGQIASDQTAKRESELQKLCELELSRQGIEFLHLSPRAREKKGWPDLSFVLPIGACSGLLPRGLPVAVELKVGSNTLSEDQIRVLDRMAGNGWGVAVVYDSLDQFKTCLDDARKGKLQCLNVTDAPTVYRTR